MALPPPSVNQTYCTVSALESGSLVIPHSTFITTAVPGTKSRVPSLSFLVAHVPSGTTVVFDLGIRKDWENLPPVSVKWIKETPWNPIVQQDASDSLGKGGLEPSEVDVVILSHAHWDHIGSTAPFTKARFIVGGESEALFKPGYPADPDSPFATSLLPTDRTEFISKEGWSPIGPFPLAHDFFGDGSFYLIDAPGHLPGHMNVLIRTSADGGWIYLAGDSAHHWALITGEAEIAVPVNGWCAHVDKPVAEENIRRIRKLTKMERVRVVLAHDEPWYEKNKGGDAFWPGKIESL